MSLNLSPIHIMDYFPDLRTKKLTLLKLRRLVHSRDHIVVQLVKSKSPLSMHDYQPYNLNNHSVPTRAVHADIHKGAFYQYVIRCLPDATSLPARMTKRTAEMTWIRKTQLILTVGIGLRCQSCTD